MEIGEIALWEKTGGRSGAYRRDAATGLASQTAAGAGGLADGKANAGSFTGSGDVVDDIDQLLGGDFSE